MSDSLKPHGLQPTRLLCPWGFSRQEYWSGLPCPPPEDLPNPVIKPRSPTLQVDSLLSEPAVKPKNTGVGSLFLLQRILLIQESNWGLLHCRWILYHLRHLSHQGSPGGAQSLDDLHRCLTHPTSTLKSNMFTTVLLTWRLTSYNFCNSLVYKGL